MTTQDPRSDEPGAGASQINMPPDGGTGGFGTYSDSMEASSALIRQFEGFISTPKWDVNFPGRLRL